ncbi:MAG: helix-hairpin-helix domain-containing protein [Thermofilaceae archaeon]
MGVAESGVIVSPREMGRGVVEVLRRIGVPVRFEEMGVVDFRVGSVGIKRLTAEEFERLTAERGARGLAEELAEAGVLVIVVEGGLDTERRHLAEAAATLALSGVSVVSTSGAEETAYVVYAFYRRMTARRRSYLPPSKLRRGSPRNLAEVQISLLTSVPGIGRETARKLLLHFKTPRRALTAPFHELEKVIGRAKARKLTDALDTIYPRALGEGSLTGGYDQPPNS